MDLFDRVDVPPQSLHAAHVVRLPASLDAGQSTSFLVSISSTPCTTRKVRWPLAHAACAWAYVSALCIARSGRHPLAWVYAVWLAALLNRSVHTCSGTAAGSP